MKWHRIYAIILRHFYILRRSPDRMSEAFYWPTIDILIWGLTSLYFSKTSNVPHFVLLIISGIIFWTVIWRGQQEITMSLLEDLWNKNLVNIFVAPLTLTEWIVAIIIGGIIKTAMSFFFATVLALILYKTSIFYYGFYLLPFLLLIILTAWSVGFFVAGLILRYSTKIQTLAWSLIAIIAPFSAIYYSLSTLPLWAQKIALFIPTTYVFEGMREVIQKGTLDPVKLYVSLVLNIIYLILSLIYLKKSFNRVLEKGLVKVY